MNKIKDNTTKQNKTLFIFNALVVASTLATLAACGKKATTEKQNQRPTPPPPPPVVVGKGNVAKGFFKIGYAGSNPVFTKSLKDVITTYTQDVTIKSKTGVEYFKLPSGLSLLSSDKFNSYLRETAEYKDQVTKLKKYLLDYNINFGIDNQKYGYYPNGFYVQFLNFDAYGNPISLNDFSYYFKDDVVSVIILDNGNSEIAGAKATFNAIFSEEKIEKVYDALKSTRADKDAFKTALTEAGISYFEENPKTFTKANGAPDKGQAGKLYINTAETAEIKELLFTKTLQELQTEFQAKTKTALVDKTKLAAKNLDALFVQVTDGVENSDDVYQAVVEKKEFGATKLFFIGDKAKSQSGASSKVFAGGNVSTASFNKYAAAYVAGFQAAVGTIKYSSSEDVYEETTTSFLIGSTWDWEAKKKAFAFRRGVEAAAAHRAYSKYLKVKFVSKTEDSSKSSKKLYREVSEWKARKDSKSKLYEFASSDTFSDANRRVIYLAGTTARDWTGYKAANIGTNADINQFKTGDDVGLIGALYNYEALPTAAKSADSLTSKTYVRGVWVILDEANSGTAADDSALKTNAGDLSQITTTNKGQINFERHEIKFYGAIGKETAGTTQYATAALKGLYMCGSNYMLDKHTIFGAPLNLEFVTRSTGNNKVGGRLASPTTFEYGTTTQSIWAAVKGNKDSTSKAKDRFDASLTHAWEKEIKEAELVKASPWLR